VLFCFFCPPPPTPKLPWETPRGLLLSVAAEFRQDRTAGLPQLCLMANRAGRPRKTRFKGRAKSPSQLLAANPGAEKQRKLPIGVGGGGGGGGGGADSKKAGREAPDAAECLNLSDRQRLMPTPAARRERPTGERDLLVRGNLSNSYQIYDLQRRRRKPTIRTCSPKTNSSGETQAS